MINRVLLMGLTPVVLGGLFLLFDPFNILKKPDLDVDKFKALSLSAQVSYLDQAGEGVSIQELRDFIKMAYPEEPSDRHDLSHKLGELAIKKDGLAGFGFCDSLLQFGCFHGAALAAVRIKGNDPELAGELWEGCKLKAKFSGNCLHGLGHAIMMIKSYDILPAYEECGRLLDNQNDAFWCQDGVSMENITRSMAPASLGEYGKDDDPYYPCNSISKQYETVCIRNHVGHLYRLWKTDFSKAVNFCHSFEMKVASECVHVLGSILQAESDYGPETMVKKCQTAGAYSRSCIEGAVVALSMSKKFDRAEELCGYLQEGEGCFSKIEYFQSL